MGSRLTSLETLTHPDLGVNPVAGRALGFGLGLKPGGTCRAPSESGTVERVLEDRVQGSDLRAAPGHARACIHHCLASLAAL